MKLFQRCFNGLALLMLSALGCTAFAQQSVTLSGRLVDELTGRPVSTAIYTVGQDVRTRGVNSGGRFNILDVMPPEVSVKFSAQGYKARERTFQVGSDIQQDVGDISLQRIVATRLPDLAIAGFDVSTVSTDADSLAIS